MVRNVYDILHYIEIHPECSFNDVEKFIGMPCANSPYFNYAAKNGWFHTRRINVRGEGHFVLTDVGKIAVDEYRDARIRSRLYIAGSVAAVLTALLKMLEYCNP